MLTCFSVIMLLYETREVSVNICLFEVLLYKQEGRAFDSRWNSEFFIDLIFPGDSASNRNQSNRNDYQELSSLFVQLMHTNYYKILEQLNSFKIIIVAPTCFGLHKPYLKLSVMWLHQSEHCNFSEAQSESSMMMVYVNRNMLEQLL